MRKQRGFTLIEIVVVLAIVALLLSMATFATRAITIQQRLSTTVAKLATVDAALIQFVMLQKRMPCPANGTLQSSDPAAGFELRDATQCTTDQTSGVVPWRTLGITENDATDGWQRRLTYRTDPTLALNNALDMSMCDPAGQSLLSPSPTCNPGCNTTALTLCTPPQAFLATKGLPVTNAAGTIVLMNPNAGPPTGAAYVLISHGETGGGAYLNSGVLAVSLAGDGAGEQKNYASLGYTAGVSSYVDDSVSDGAGTNHFDDMLSHPTILTVINKAALGPRSH